MLSLLNEVEECEYKYPHEVYEVPEKSDFLYHFIVSASFKYTAKCHEENNNVDHNPLHHVETVETGDEEEEISILLLNSVFIFVKVGTENQSVWSHGIHHFLSFCTGHFHFADVLAVFVLEHVFVQDNFKAALKIAKEVGNKAAEEVKKGSPEAIKFAGDQLKNAGETIKKLGNHLEQN